MSKYIPQDIMAQYGRVISKIKNGYLTLDNYQSKVVRVKDVPIEMEKWYIIDVSGGDIDEFDIRYESANLEILYPTSHSYPSHGNRQRVNGYWAEMYHLIHYIVPNIPLSKLYPYPSPLHFTKSYGIGNCSYIPLEINYDGTFMNWSDENPLEVKE